MLSSRYVRIVMSWIYENRRVICPILHDEMTQIIISFQKNNGINSVTH